MPNSLPPSSWYTLGYNDAVAPWHAPATILTDPAGLANEDWASIPAANTAEEVLVRKSFAMPGGIVVLAAQIYCGQDATLLEIYFNNVNVFTGNVPTTNLTGYRTYNVDPSTIVLGSTNTMAFHFSAATALGRTGGSPEPGYAFYFAYQTP